MSKQPDRMVALDVLRGLTILLMIIVNNPGSWTYVYSPLRHAPWDGCTPTDLVFPFFMFIVGTAMWYSFKKQDYRLNPSLTGKIIKRTILIFSMGLFLNAFPFKNFDPDFLRIMGVLQRIAFAYGMAAFMVLLFPIRWNYVIIGVLLLGYWGILHLFGGEDPLSLEGNVVRQTDLFILGESHMYHGYGIPFDPEGLLSTVPSVANILFGFLAGRLIDQQQDRLKSVYQLIGWGTTGIVAALLWNPLFPINKPIWSSSYVLYSCGLASILLAILIWIIDIKRKQKWAHPLLVYGMNPLFILMLAGIWADLLSVILIPGADGGQVPLKTFIYQELLVPWAGKMNGSLLFALHYAVLFWLVGFILYRKKIFIKI
ncbi:MAG: acyltransferase family protein [Mangrovibacterium sp.]